MDCCSGTDADDDSTTRLGSSAEDFDTFFDLEPDLGVVMIVVGVVVVVTTAEFVVDVSFVCLNTWEDNFSVLMSAWTTLSDLIVDLEDIGVLLLAVCVELLGLTLLGSVDTIGCFDLTLLGGVSVFCRFTG